MKAATIDLDRIYTAEEYLTLDEGSRPTELVRGRVVEMTVPAPRHGQVCSRIDRLVGNYADEHNIGHVIANDSGVRTQRGPDTVRGPDVSFYSYSRVPPGPMPGGYLDVVPELVFEVLSPSDSWPRLISKAREYFEAGVGVVCALDPESECLVIHRPNEFPIVLHNSDEFHLPTILGDFRVPVCRFFA